MSDDPHRIIGIDLDQTSIVRWSAEVEHERNVAIFDLLEANFFKLRSGLAGPYKVSMALREATLVLNVVTDGLALHEELLLPVRPLRQVIKDYFLIVDSYFKAVKGANPSRIEAIDMARRGLHNEGSELLREALVEKVEVDFNTARRLFTLVCVLHIRG